MRELGKYVLDYQGERNVASRRSLFERLGRHTKLVLAPFGQAVLLVSTDDREVGRTVFVRGDYERSHLATAVTYLQAHSGFSPSGKVFLDVGANIGTCTVDALVHFGFAEAVCFEPDSRNFKLLRANILLNDLDRRASLHQVALSDRDSLGVLEYSPDNFGDTRLLTSPEGASGTSAMEEVQCVRLDSLVKEGTIPLERVGLVWIDTQGHEALVLGGASSLMDAGVPMVAEYWPDGLGARGTADLEELIKGNFQRVVDLGLLIHGLEGGAVLEADQIGKLRHRYKVGEHTDLLLIS